MNNLLKNILQFTFAACIFLLLLPQICNAKQKATQNTDTNQANSNNVDEISIDDVRRFTMAISQIKNFYVKNVKDEKLFDDAIRGMLKGLDPHSAYLDKEEFADLQTSTKGSFGGLGIEITTEDGYVKVISPIDDTPAHKAGIKAGDFIIKLDDKSVHGMKLKDAVKLMRGLKGTPITLTVLRKKESKALIFKIVRDIIKIKSIKSALFENKYGYIRISHFQSSTAKDFIKAINLLNQKSGGVMSGLILDLRNNPGGLLDSAIEISDALIHNDQKNEEELIVYTKGRSPGSDFTAIATPGDILKNEPIVVLINNGSASGSEIVAGALRDNDRALLIGTKSFGKGSVQTVIPLGNKRGIKLTTSLYYTPDGHSIQAKGLKPDIVLEDIKLPKKEEKEENLTLSEANLNGHIKNQQQKINAKTKSLKSTLLDGDYHLNEALNMLKAMKVASNNVKSPTVKTKPPTRKRLGQDLR